LQKSYIQINNLFLSIIKIKKYYFSYSFMLQQKLKIFLCSLLFALCSLLKSQNLVPNPSFEIYDTCPNQQAQVNYALPWFDPTKTSSDYFNACCTTSATAGVPNNFYGYKQAQNGNAIMGLFPYNPPFSNNYREYIGAKLNNSLDSNKTYCFSCYFSPSGYMMYATNGLGVLLLKDTTGISNYYLNVITIAKSMIDTTIVSDTSSWKKIEFTIVNSSANYLIIGCFLHDNELHLQVINSNGYPASYYYIDNIKLEDCTPTFFEIPNIVTDNNDGINDVFFIKGLQENTEVNIYNRWGTIVYYTDNYKNDWKPDVNSGIYYYVIRTVSKMYTGFLEIIA